MAISKEVCMVRVTFGMGKWEPARPRDEIQIVLQWSHKTSSLWISESPSIKWGIGEVGKDEVADKVPSSTECLKNNIKVQIPLGIRIYTSSYSLKIYLHLYYRFLWRSTSVYLYLYGDRNKQKKFLTVRIYRKFSGRSFFFSLQVRVSNVSYASFLL